MTQRPSQKPQSAPEVHEKQSVGPAQGSPVGGVGGAPLSAGGAPESAGGAPASAGEDGAPVAAQAPPSQERPNPQEAVPEQQAWPSPPHGAAAGIAQPSAVQSSPE